jgi:hypothetical protein
MRYAAQTRTERQIKTEEQKLLEQHETEQAQGKIQKLRDAEQKRLQKKK